jgi:AmmeMemoRadiSam system protein A
VADLAAAVADSDPRFTPVTVAELDDLLIEISVLTPEREIAAAEVDEIEIGRHGLIVTRGARRGLLLPQVAVAHGWDVTTFLQQSCLKAGLHPQAWREEGTVLSVFEADVFGEAPRAADVAAGRRRG